MPGSDARVLMRSFYVSRSQEPFLRSFRRVQMRFFRLQAVLDHEKIQDDLWHVQHPRSVLGFLHVAEDHHYPPQLLLQRNQYTRSRLHSQLND